MNWFNSVLDKYIQFQKKSYEEKLSNTTFANYFKNIII